jgi:SWI/SNF-related matrix-associated actin-dependent regulator 1 of chromatin subfamily A
MEMMTMPKKTNDNTIKIGYSIDRKKFLVKYSPYNLHLEKTMKFLGRSQASLDLEKNVWLIEVSMINAIKLSANVVNVAKGEGYKVIVTNTFVRKKELLANHIKTGKNKLGQRSKYEKTLRTKPLPRKLAKAMMPFQIEGFDYLVQKNGRALLADDMGLGKTLQVLAFMKTYRSIKRIVVISPKTIKHVWDNECTKWGIEDLRWIIDGSPSTYGMQTKKVQLEDGERTVVKGQGLREFDFRICIINYEMVQKWLPFLKHWKPDMLVCDEIHYIKNRKAARTKAVEALGHKVPYVIGMTGTPVANSPMELFTISNMVRPDMFNYIDFNYRFCGGEAMLCRQAHNGQELHEIMKNTIMLRRLKGDVLKELEPKRSIQVELELDMKNYDAILDEWAAQVDVQASSMSFQAKLRECIANDKIPALLEWTDKFLEDTGRKLIIFAHHAVIRDMLVSHYGESCVTINGQVKSADRKTAEYRFQNDDSIRVFVGSITACAEGITLTASSDVCMAEMIYNPKKMEQAEDRAHRKGQNNHVTIWNLVCTGTYETDVLDLLTTKRIMAAQVVDGQSEDQAQIDVAREITYKLVDMVTERKYR